jgi:hypothetical protein
MVLPMVLTAPSSKENSGARREQQMPPKSPLLRGEQKARFGRRDMLAGLAAAALLWPMNPAGATEPVSIGLNLNWTPFVGPRDVGFKV